MEWKKQLRALELNKEWDFAIEFMQQVIAENSNDLDAYLSMNYLLMNLLVEEDYDRTRQDFYIYLTKKYFDESYAKFSHNPEYLFYTGKTAYMSEWFFGIEQEDAKAMLQKAMELDPGNILYKDTFYTYLDLTSVYNKQQVLAYAKLVLSKNSPIKKILQEKGALGEYILEITMSWSKRVVKNIDTCGSSIYN